LRKEPTAREWRNRPDRMLAAHLTSTWEIPTRSPYRPSRTLSRAEPGLPSRHPQLQTRSEATPCRTRCWMAYDLAHAAARTLPDSEFGDVLVKLLVRDLPDRHEPLEGFEVLVTQHLGTPSDSVEELFGRLIPMALYVVDDHLGRDVHNVVRRNQNVAAAPTIVANLANMPAAKIHRFETILDEEAKSRQLRWVDTSTRERLAFAEPTDCTNARVGGELALACEVREEHGDTVQGRGALSETDWAEPTTKNSAQT
jgi:hypothetical protein